MNSEIGGGAPRGWFYQHRKHFTVNRLLGASLAISIAEAVVTVAVAFSSGASFGEEFSCDTLLAVMVVAVVFTGE